MFELPKILIVVKNCIVHVGFGNIPPELTSIELALEIIPAEHQMKFFMTTNNFWLPKEPLVFYYKVLV